MALFISAYLEKKREFGAFSERLIKHACLNQNKQRMKPGPDV